MCFVSLLAEVGQTNMQHGS